MIQAPQTVIPSTLEITPVETRTLKNGLRLHTLQANEFEVVRLTLVFHAGPVTQQSPFVAGATANLLAEGSDRLSGREIAERLDFYGSYYEVNLDRDYVYISFCSLRKYFHSTLEMAEEILLHPAFPEEEVITYRTKRQQQLAIERRKVDVTAREAFVESLFGAEHPYGVCYPESAYEGLSRQQLLDHYHCRYTAAHALAVCSGHIGDEERQGIEALCEKLPAGEAAPLHFPTPRSISQRYIERSEAVQSAIRIGRLLFPRRHPDFVGMQVVSTLLGGYFGARLMHNLREEHGYTYGVMATVVNFEREGYFAIATQVGSEVTEEALKEIFYEIERLRTEEVSEQELDLAKNILTGEMMRILDGPFGIADVAIENILSGEDHQAVNRTLQEIRQITPQRVRELADRYLNPDDLSTIVVGKGLDWKQD
ncbi:MAG: insulinase family protein [Alistipes sp.]|nr:insulinase family protein [Alistipes sp.]